jgi:hypothetical protein
MGCLRGCLLRLIVIFVLVMVVRYVLQSTDIPGVEALLLIVAVAAVVGIAIFGHHTHWDAG